jgi:hypothetical protein
MFEENVFLVNLDQKLHKALGVSLFLSIVQNKNKVEAEFKRKREEAKKKQEESKKKELKLK